MKKNKNIEMKIYELLGVKIFKKIVMNIYELLWIPLTPSMTKEERQKKIYYHKKNNYIMGRINNLEDIEQYKNVLNFNTLAHLISLICTGYGVIFFNISPPLMISIIAFSIMNIYCLMLQRYNWIRINQVIKKHASKYEKQKEEIKETLVQENALIKEHTYKIINIRKRTEKNVSFEELLENATIEQLNQYREFLINYKEYNEREMIIDINSKLRLELVQKKNLNNGKKDDRN